MATLPTQEEASVSPGGSKKSFTGNLTLWAMCVCVLIGVTAWQYGLEEGTSSTHYSTILETVFTSQAPLTSAETTESAS